MIKMKTEVLPGEYSVEKIVDRRVKKREKKYLVNWRGYPESENTWEPRKHLNGYRNLIIQFEKERFTNRRQNMRKFSAVTDLEKVHGKIYFKVKWITNMGKEIMSAQEVYKKWPQKAIKFFEDRIVWVGKEFPEEMGGNEENTKKGGKWIVLSEKLV